MESGIKAKKSKYPPRIPRLAEVPAADLPPAKRKISREESEEVAQKIQLLGPLIISMDLEVLEGALEALNHKSSTDDAIGCLIHPEGYEERGDVMRAQADYLKGLIAVRKAQGDLREAMEKQQRSKGQRREIFSALGLG